MSATQERELRAEAQIFTVQLRAREISHLILVVDGSVVPVLGTYKPATFCNKSIDDIADCSKVSKPSEIDPSCARCQKVYEDNGYRTCPPVK